MQCRGGLPDAMHVLSCNTRAVDSLRLAPRDYPTSLL